MPSLLEQPVSAVMEKEFVAVKKEDGIRKIIEIMAKKRLPFIPVVGNFDVLVGTISEHDLLKVFNIPAPPGVNITNISEELINAGLERTAGDIMTSKPITLNESSPVSDAVRMLTNNQVHFIPVVNNGDVVVGVLSLLDIVSKK